MRGVAKATQRRGTATGHSDVKHRCHLVEFQEGRSDACRSENARTAGPECPHQAAGHGEAQRCCQLLHPAPGAAPPWPGSRAPPGCCQDSGSDLVHVPAEEERSRKRGKESAMEERRTAGLAPFPTPRPLRPSTAPQRLLTAAPFPHRPPSSAAQPLARSPALGAPTVELEARHGPPRLPAGGGAGKAAPQGLARGGAPAAAAGGGTKQPQQPPPHRRDPPDTGILLPSSRAAPPGHVTASAASGRAGAAGEPMRERARHRGRAEARRPRPCGNVSCCWVRP